MMQTPRNVREYEVLARKVMRSTYWDYYDLPGEQSQTCSDSIAAFKRYRFRPDVLSDVSSRRLSTTVLGRPIRSPIGVAPSAHHRFAHKDAEIGTAKGTSAAGTLMIQSTFSNTHVSDVSAAVPDGIRWMQIYIFKDRNLTKSLIRQAKKAGYSAIVFTVDSPVTGWSVEEYRNNFGYDKLLRSPNLELGLPGQIEAEKNGDLNFITYYESQFNSKLTWQDIRWIKGVTSLPVVCKGILTAKAAIQAADAGADAIIVSAHGGRQLDGVPAPIDALAEVAEAVHGWNVEVYMDGGVRTGSDVLKALARGAKAVFVGRPALWGLACEGAEGVERILNILRDELDYAMGLCGCSDVNAIPSDVVVPEAYYNIPRHKL